MARAREAVEREWLESTPVREGSSSSAAPERYPAPTLMISIDRVAGRVLARA